MNIRIPFFIISAYKAGLSEETNQQRHQFLRRMLLSGSPALYADSEVEGTYNGVQERAFKVAAYDMQDEDKVCRLAKQFEQESVLYVDANWQAYLVFVQGPFREKHLGTWTGVQRSDLLTTDDYAKIGDTYYSAI